MNRMKNPPLRALIFSSLLALALCLPAAQAQTAYLVRDLQPGEDNSGSGPFTRAGSFVPLGDKVVFLAEAAGSGQEVWVSDGTAAGTEILVDVCPGVCSSRPRILGVRRGILYWASTTSQGTFSSPSQLWRTDGTRAGTFALTDFGDANPGEVERLTFAFTSRLLLFTSCLGDDCSLWRTDGTVAGTVKVSGLPASFRHFAVSLAAVGERVYFSFENNFQGELWVTDESGRTATRVRVFPGSFASGLTGAGNRLFFVASEGDGAQLWSTDGTAAGTRVLTQFLSQFPVFPFGIEGWHLAAFGNRVYFVANDAAHGNEVWRSDGTAAGTVRITDFAFPSPFGDSLEPRTFEEIGGRLLFVANDGLHGPRLWANTGTVESTLPLQEPGSTVRFGLFRAGQRVLFAGRDEQHGVEPWSSDGTAAGTQRVRDVCPGVCDSIFTPLQAIPGGVAFLARDSAQGFQRNFWRSDGTAAGTRRITAFQEDLELDTTPEFGMTAAGRLFFSSETFRETLLWVSDGTPRGAHVVDRLAHHPAGSDPFGLEPLGDRLFFTACTDGLARNKEVWQTSGTPESTAAVTNGGGSCRFSNGPLDLATAGPRLFFGYDPEGSFQGSQELWKIEGTSSVAERLAVLPPGWRFRSSLTVLGNQVFFLLEEPQTSRTEVWRSDGTVPGTGRFDLPGARTFFHLASTGQELFLLGIDQEESQALWISNGTVGGTRKLLSGAIDFFRGVPDFVRLGPSVYFGAQGETGGNDLWVTDGTVAGTRRVVTVSPFAFRPLANLTAHQGALYFFQEASQPGLWRSDGTQAGTFELRTFRNRDLSLPAFLIPFAGAVYFGADGGDGGFEIWRSDGTPAGTAMLRDIAPGDADSLATELKVVGDRLFFVANDRIHGFELWQTDGTAAGTRMVQDVAPGALSSQPQQLTATSGRLYFSADDGLSGRELWALPLAGAAGCQPSSTRLCLRGGRFQVDVVWRDFQGRTGAGQAVPLTADTGYFWFFDPANVETVVKVLDGEGLNGHQWVFYGALSNVEYTLTVTDTRTNLTRRYFNPAGNFASVGDTQGFGPLGAFSSVPLSTSGPAAGVLAEERTDPAAATGSCQAGPRRLCLNGGRFAVEVAWKDFQNRTGAGQAVPLTGDTGYFWFFDAANVEVVTKVLDGTGLNGKFWFFYGALSSVEYRITVTDTTTGTVKTYVNPAGRFASVGDTGAF